MKNSEALQILRRVADEYVCCWSDQKLLRAALVKAEEVLVDEDQAD